MKYIYALVIGIIALAISGVVSANGIIWSSDSDGNEKNVFSPSENVYVGGALLPSGYVDVYVVLNEEWNAGEQIDKGSNVVLFYSGVSTSDIDINSIGPFFLGTVSNDGGSSDIPYPGKYDIVVDVDRNGYYNSGDLVDYYACQGFETIPEFTTVAIPLAIAMLAGFFYLRRQ